MGCFEMLLICAVNKRKSRVSPSWFLISVADTDSYRHSDSLPVLDRETFGGKTRDLVPCQFLRFPSSKLARKLDVPVCKLPKVQSGVGAKFSAEKALTKCHCLSFFRPFPQENWASSHNFTKRQHVPWWEREPIRAASRPRGELLHCAAWSLRHGMLRNWSSESANLTYPSKISWNCSGRGSNSNLTISQKAERFFEKLIWSSFFILSPRNERRK